MRPLTLLAPALTLLTACPLTMTPGMDTAPPTAVIKVRGANDQQYAPATKATMCAATADKLDIICVVSDPNGVSRVDLAFSDTSDGCTTVTGGVYMGSFTISPIPAEEKQVVQAMTLNEVPLLATLQGPFQCPISGVGKGTPYGAQIKVTCTGQNFSSNPQLKSAQATLVVTLK